jgi:hypothetical protein
VLDTDAHEPEFSHRSPSAGSIIKKMHEMNPNLGTHAMIEIVRQSMRIYGGDNPDFAQLEVIDEEKALSLVRATLSNA